MVATRDPAEIAEAFNEYLIDSVAKIAHRALRFLLQIMLQWMWLSRLFQPSLLYQGKKSLEHEVHLIINSLKGSKPVVWIQIP